MMWRGSVIPLLLIGAGATVQAQGSSACQPSETLGQCFTRMRDGERMSEQQSAVRYNTTRATVGPQTADDVLGSTVRDFLPPIAAALLTPGLDADRAALSLRANRRFPFATLQLVADFPEPEIFAPLLEDVPEANRDAVRERLKERLEDQDDVAGSIAVNVENGWFGRSFRPHAAEIGYALQRLLPRLTPEQEAPFDDALEQAFVGARGNMDASRLGDAACNPNGSPTNWRFDCLQPQFRPILVSRFRTAIRALIARAELRRGVLESLRLDLLSMLLNNQPQLNATATYHYRDDLVGPDEVTGSLRLEVGWQNLNSLRSRCRREQSGAVARTEALGNCLVSVLRGADDDIAEAIGRGQRFTLKVDLHSRAEYDFALASEGIAVAEDRSLELDGGLAYGQYFGKLADGTRRPRIDGDVSYKHQLDGELRNDRLVAKIAFTQPLSDQLGAVFGALWANKPEYVGEVQRRVSATVGLTYKLVQRE